MFHRILDRFEELLILTFIAAATLVTFVSVAMRYLMGTGFPWATELTIYLFIWIFYCIQLFFFIFGRSTCRWTTL